MKFETSIDDSVRLVELNEETGRARISVPERETAADDRPYAFSKIDETRFLLRRGTASHIIANAKLNEDESSVEFTIDGVWQQVSVKDEQALLLARMGFKAGAKSSQGVLKAPMPGKVLQVLVEEGEQVQMGEPVVILEAMKMENELKAPVAGRLASIHVEAGSSVEKNHALLEIEPLG